MTDNHSPANGESPAGPGDRLNSWKEIAAYLQRDVRTVQRWERIDALPVHRHPTPGIGGVYAFKAELDAWWRTPEAGDPGLAQSEPARPVSRRSWATWAVLAVAMAAAAAGGWYALSRGGLVGRPPEVVGMQATRVWEGPELTFTTSFSADARHVFYVDWTTGDLAILDPRTRQRRRLTDNGSWFHPYDRHEWAGDPRASSDGTLVAFGWGKGGWNELRVARIDGSALRTVYRDPAVSSISTYEWSRSGDQILVGLLKQDGSRSLALISASDGRVVFEKPTAIRPNGATLSPDGRYLAYDRSSQGGGTDRDIWVMSVPDGRDAPLMAHSADDVVPLWSADGNEVLFLSDRTGIGALWSQPVAQGAARGEPRVVRHDMTRAWPIGLDADGTLTYALIANDEDVFVVDLDPRTGRASGTPRAASPQSMGTTRGMTWSPDGSRLACIRGHVVDSHQLFSANREDTLWIRSAAGGDDRQAPCPLTSMWLPRWSPDGRSMLVRGSGPDLPFALYRLDVAAGTVKLAGPPGPPRMYGWFAGNDALFYKDWGGPAIVRELASGRERTISAPADDNLAVSPDGKWVAYSTHNSASGLITLTVAAAGGAPREIVRMMMPEWISALTWTPNGRQIVFAKSRRDTLEGELLTIGLDGGNPVPVGVKTHHTRDVQISPDGRRLAYLERVNRGEVWRLTNVSRRVRPGA